MLLNKYISQINISNILSDSSRPDQSGPEPSLCVGVASPDLGGVQLRVRDEGGVDVDDHVQDAQGEGAVDGPEYAKHIHS